MLSGMVASNLGFIPTDYLDCPINPEGISNVLRPIIGEKIKGWVVPGLRCENRWQETDVMRGEECQIIGAFCSSSFNSNLNKNDAILCLPGTHTKWVLCENGNIKTFNTSVTGELYKNLIEQSIFSQANQTFSLQSFLGGVSTSKKNVGLNQLLFSCRTRVLQGNLDKEHSDSYLSGLLIGCEIKGQIAMNQEMENLPVFIIGDEHLTNLYHLALAQFKLASIALSGAEFVCTGLNYLFRKISQLSPTCQES